MIKRFILIFFLFIKVITLDAQIREIPIYNLNDAAVATFDNFGPVIYYNPIYCQQMGPLAASFVKAHEYGHHELGHLVQSMLNANNPYVQYWLSRNMENEADAYAVKVCIEQQNIQAIQAGFNLYWANDNVGDNTHLPSRVRANNILQYYYQLTGFNLFP